MAEYDARKIRKLASEYLREEYGDDAEIAHIEVSDPARSEEPFFLVSAANKDEPNNPKITFAINAAGDLLDIRGLLEEKGERLFSRDDFGTLKSRLRPAQAAEPITIHPDRNEIRLSPGQTKQETIRVTIPSRPSVEKLDVYFLADVTGSMGPVVDQVKNSSNAILNAVRAMGFDAEFGVGSYGDFPGPPAPFSAIQPITANDADIANAIATWNPVGGGDLPEAQLFALDRIAEDTAGQIGWRDGSKRVIVWFGDAPGHEPICAALSGLGSDLSTISVADKLFRENVTVVAISATTSSRLSLDSDPTSGVFTPEYDVCGPPRGFPGQASTIAGATGGVHLTNVEPTAIVQAIIDSVGQAAGTIGEVRLDPVPFSGQFVSSIQPPEFNSLPAGEDQTLEFVVTFQGTVECTNEEQEFLGRITLRIEGVAVAEKFLMVTVPACGDDDDDDEIPVPVPDPVPEPIVYDISGAPSSTVSRRDINNDVIQISVFVRGENNSLLVCTNSGNPEDPMDYNWENLEKPVGTRVSDSPFALASSQPHVDQNADLVHGLVKTSNGHLYERQFDGTNWVDWIDHGQPTWNRSVAASPAGQTYRAAYLVEGGIFEDDYYLNQTDDHIHKFVWGSDGLLYYHDQSWLTRGRPINQADVASPAGVARSLYHIYAYVVGNDRSLYVNHSTNLQADSWVWRRLGMPDQDADVGAHWFRRPGVGYFRFDGNQFFYTFVTGTDSHLWVHRWRGHTRQVDLGDWTDLGRPGAGLSVRSSAAVVSSGSRLYAFVRGSDNNLHVCFWNDPPGIWQWTNLGLPDGVSLRDDPTAVSLDAAPRDPLYVYARGEDKRLHLCHLNADATSIEWNNVGG